FPHVNVATVAIAGGITLLVTFVVMAVMTFRSSREPSGVTVVEHQVPKERWTMPPATLLSRPRWSAGRRAAMLGLGVSRVVALAPSPGSQPSFTPLGTYSTSIAGGLSGWYDAADSDQPFIAANHTAGMAGAVPAGALALQPARDRLLALAWTSPLPAAHKVVVS